jgi:DNA-binding NarL/FixJ family response regulator
MPQSPDLSNDASQKAARIFLVDDHAMMRTGLRNYIHLNSPWKICGEASSAGEAMAMLPEAEPDVVILDLTLPDMNGIELLRRMKKLRPETEAVVYTALDVEAMINQAFEAGARSYLNKSDDIQQLIQAIEAALTHKPFFTQRVSEVLFRRFHATSSSSENAASGSDLTPRENEAIRIIAKGASNRELAETLGVGLRTAEGYRASIMRKLQLKTIGELIRYAIRNGIVEG